MRAQATIGVPEQIATAPWTRVPARPTARTWGDAAYAVYLTVFIVVIWGSLAIDALRGATGSLPAPLRPRTIDLG